ncbi:cell division control protein 45 homolog [Achroia grisella]|uniref:cell division control protein 45 homolog n=1 Tax=Achroia grisella TaxID=688607 RepID=UPI0027D34BCA|nr:cell division control protein 45 homolog [Achroia grisella]
MFIDDIKTDFYDVLLGNRVLLLVHCDVDAVCTCKILQELFKCDNISYTLVPVGGISELKTAYEENSEEIKYVVLINCGGTIDLVDILQPEEDVVFFVLDSHKPTDICNVYSDGQVRLVHKDSEENIPNFDDIFRDDEEEENEEQASGMEALEAMVEKRKERRAWEERRHTLMFNYTQFSYYGKPSAMVALEVSWRASRGGTGAHWAAAVALTAHQASHARAPAAALLDAHPLHRRLAATHHQDHQVPPPLPPHQASHARAPAAALLDAHPLHRRLAATHHQDHQVPPPLPPHQASHARAPAAALLDAHPLHRRLAATHHQDHQVPPPLPPHQASHARAPAAALLDAHPLHRRLAATHHQDHQVPPPLPPHQASHARAPAAALLDAHPLHRRLAATHHQDHQCAHVVLENDVWLPLYRSWTLEAALRHAPDIAPYLKLHTLAGDARVRQLLADMGYPVSQARQSFGAMDVELRRGLRPALEAAAARLGLPPPARAALLLRAPRAAPRAALDLALGVTALLHHSMPRGVGFQHALAALDVSGRGEESFTLALQAARAALQATAALANATLAARATHLAGPFGYFVVQEGSAGAGWARGAAWLAAAARWVSRARPGGAPLLASAPRGDDTCLLLGIPPNYDDEPRNLFGAAFEQAASRCGASVQLDYVDSWVVALPTAQRPQFLDALTALLA